MSLYAFGYHSKTCMSQEAVKQIYDNLNLDFVCSIRETMSYVLLSFKSRVEQKMSDELPLFPKKPWANHSFFLIFSVGIE